MSLCLALALLGASCGGGNSMPDSSPTPPAPATATLVVVLAAPSLPVSVFVDGDVLAQNLSYMTATNPLIVSSGQHELLLDNSQGEAVASNGQSLNLQPSSHTTVLYIFPAVFGTFVQVLTDDTTPAPNSMAKLRVANFTFNAVVSGPYDVYVVPFGSAPSGTPFLTNVGSQSPAYQTVAPGNYDVYFVTEQSNSGQPPPTVLYHTGSLQLAANQNRSIYFLTTCQDPSGASGCTPNGFATVTVADLN
ncbi:MAG TPA: DUF4397 domain-containing protein [Candidatus Eremiobacteraceae bacterium]|jgi:hypothetical protein|nr:DUF4397 domain-containing protein [Candidatus Eremiobacteraceae bacterium]